MHATHLWPDSPVMAASEALPSPGLLVAVYWALWLVLVASMAWMAVRQHAQVKHLDAMEARLQSRLARLDRADMTDGSPSRS